jgi:DNA-binding MarR family transcriptional regulator
MGEQGLVTRMRDERDRRNVVIKRTVDGALYLERLGDLIIAGGRKLAP